MNKAKTVLAAILFFAALGAAMTTRTRSFIGFVADGTVYSPVYVPFNCPSVGWGCIYTSSDNMTYQVYTLSGVRFTPVRP